MYEKILCMTSTQVQPVDTTNTLGLVLLIYTSQNYCNIGQITGFTNIGDINNHLMKFKKSIESGEKEEPLAKSMLVVMVRELFSKLQFAYAQFSCSSLNGCQLYPIFWEAVERLERCGFRVIGCTCDQ